MDPLAILASREDVAEATERARTSIDAVLMNRAVRNDAANVVAHSIRSGAQASAAIDGADVAEVDASPMGRVLMSALRVTAEVPGQVDAWTTSPLQVLAHLHARVAKGFVTDDELGRPRSSDHADDPLNIGELPAAVEVTPRLEALAALLTMPTAAPALVLAAVVHGELLDLRPFTWGSGIIARAAVRLTLASRGVDPELFTIPEAGMHDLGRPAYVNSIRAYASGEPIGVAEWLIWHADAIESGAKRAASHVPG